MLTTTRRRRLLAALTLPLLVLLAGCGRFTADFEIQDVDTLHLSLDVGIETTWIDDEFDSAEAMCADLGGDTGGTGVYDEVPFEPYEEDGMWGCRASATVDRAAFGSDLELTEQDGEFHLSIAGDDAAPVTQSELEMAGVSDFEFRMSFSFPGDVIESSGGEVDGDTVTFTDVGEVSQGIEIRAEAGGFPWLIVVVAVVLIGGFFLLVALAVVGFLIYRSRKNSSGGPGAPAAPPAAVSGGAGIGAGAGAGAQEGQQGWPGQPGQPGQPGGNQQPPPPPGGNQQPPPGW